MKPDDPFAKYTSPPEEDDLWRSPPKSDEEETNDLLSSLDEASLSDPEIRAKLETLMIRTLFSLLEDPKSAPTHKLGAIKEIKEIYGIGKTKDSSHVSGENVQVNNLLDIDQARHLLENLPKASDVARGTDSGTRPLEGGKGA